MTYRVLMTALVLALLPFGSADAKSPSKVLATPLVKTGMLRVARGVGGRLVQLTDEQGKRWLLLGRWTKEFKRLNNHPVRVWATRGKKKMMMRSLLVSRYELLAVANRKPLVGHLRRGTSKLVLKQANREVEISGQKPFLKRLRRHLGCKIWLVGDLADGKLKAFKFGWLDCDKRTPIKPKRKETTK